MADTVSQEAFITVRGIFQEGKPQPLEVEKEFGLGNVQEGADDPPLPLPGYRGEAFAAASPKEPHEEGFCLIVPGMGRGDAVPPSPLPLLAEGFVPELPGPLFQVSPCRGIPVDNPEREIDLFGETPQMLLLSIALRPQPVVDVEDSQGKGDLCSQLHEEKNQSRGIGSPGTGRENAVPRRNEAVLLNALPDSSVEGKHGWKKVAKEGFEPPTQRI